MFSSLPAFSTGILGAGASARDFVQKAAMGASLMAADCGVEDVPAVDSDVFYGATIAASVGLVARRTSQVWRRNHPLGALG